MTLSAFHFRSSKKITTLLRESRFDGAPHMIWWFVCPKIKMELFSIDHPPRNVRSSLSLNLSLEPTGNCHQINAAPIYAPSSVVIPLYKSIVKGLREDPSKLGNIKETKDNGLLTRMAECEDREE